ncbi:hypothetical protein [Lichenibacterium dinghuense]|uniref:hypothetical protein n=1 Tax=Lichenibacterium dinghuense TaxID=2895977 RepID=UPI001F1EB537|nr:hypothetical protein [Lichenibacterium sp. 6Y81]
MLVTPREKHIAKIANERVKLIAALLNSLAASALIGSLVAPFIAGSVVDPFWSALVAGSGALLHLLGHVVLDFSKPEQ